MDAPWNRPLKQQPGQSQGVSCDAWRAPPGAWTAKPLFRSGGSALRASDRNDLLHASIAMNQAETMPPIAPEVLQTLQGISTPTITTILLKKGLRNVWIRGARPLHPGSARKVGRAFTLRFIPAREDLATPAAWASPRSTRAAIEAMPEGCIAVADAGGRTDAGIFGDILCQRMALRGVAGLVTDGVVRDIQGVSATGLHVWCQGTAAPASATGLIFVNWQDPVGCGGVAVYPGELIVADDDGAVVIPEAFLADVLAAGPEQERLEAWIMEQVKAGASLPGLYPPDAQAMARYEARQPAANPRE